MGDVANSFEYGLNVAAKAYDGINKYIRITDIDDVSCKFLFNNLTSPNVNISEAINYQLKKGDILFARTGASVGKTYLYSEKDGMVFYAGFLIRAKISSSYDSNFIFQNTLTESYRRYIQITSQRSGQPGVNAQEYGEYKLMIPRLLEQKKIGNYFKYLDTLITLHQRKLNILKSVPKFLLGIVWEQRKLGACFEERCENMPDGELISVTISDGIKKFSELGRHDNSNQDKSKYKKVCIGDIAYNSMRMWQGASGYSPFEGIVSPAYTVLKPNVNINSKCVSYLFKRQDMIHVFQLNSQGITSDNWNLKFPALSQIAVSLPGDIKEQSRIATYFSNIDTLITLHQRKLEKLKIIKKSMLEKCFPKKGEKVPKIRFSGFTDDWEQRKLGDIVTRVIRKNENLESKLPLTISAQFGLIAQDEFFDKRIASKNISHYYLIRKGEFAYNKSTSMDAPWGAIKRLEHYDNGVLSTLYIMFRILDENKVNSDYIVSYYVTNLWHKGVREVAAEGARNHGLLNIAPVDFFETTLTIPSNENEQKNIGEYFRRLDRLITLHQRQQNLWKFVRKGVKLWIILTKNQILKRP